MRKLIMTCAIAACSTGVSAADVRYLGENIEGRPVVSIVGDLERTDIERFADVTRDLEAAVVLFESYGGSLEAGLEIGTRIRMRGFSSLVANGKQCRSACALAWLGGVTRFSGEGAVVSFHAAYNIEDGIAQESGSGNALVGAYAANLGLQQDTILFLTTASPEESNVLTPEWADWLGLAVTFGDTNNIASIIISESKKDDRKVTVAAEDVEGVLQRANNGDAESQWMAALIYLEGKVVEKDLIQALHWFTLSAEAGFGPAQHALGLRYLRGEGAEKDPSKAAQWFRLAAEQGDAEAQANLGFMYENGQGVPQDDAEAVKWYRLAADQGDAAAQINLGVMYSLGQGVPQDYAEAVKWYRLAADQGDARAQNNLGFMYANGQGVPQDYAEAVKWYRLAADQGDAEAQVNLGVMYANGRGVPQDGAEAVKWTRLAADQGFARALFYLGSKYANGHGVPQDDAEAAKWYRLAAEQGHVIAQYYLGWMYRKGTGVIFDAAEAVRWFRLAADQGDAMAQFTLGNMYANGEDVPQDYVTAHMWLNITAANGMKSAADVRDHLEQHMPPEDISEATRRATLCMASNYADCD